MIFLKVILELDKTSKNMVSKHFIRIMTLEESNLLNKSDKILL
jgi:hypothetical protein